MSKANVELFYARLYSDPGLQNSLSAGVSSQAELVERAVAAAQAQGLTFTVEEANAWIAEQTAVRNDGELSDVQLEGVAGGKGGRQPQGLIGAIGVLFGGR